MKTIEVTRAVLRDLDPMHLICIGCPSDEYDHEAFLIFLSGDCSMDTCRRIFVEMFDSELVENIDFMEMSRKIDEAWCVA